MIRRQEGDALGPLGEERGEHEGKCFDRLLPGPHI